MYNSFPLFLLLLVGRCRLCGPSCRGGQHPRDDEIIRWKNPRFPASTWSRAIIISVVTWERSKKCIDKAIARALLIARSLKLTFRLYPLMGRHILVLANIFTSPCMWKLFLSLMFVYLGGKSDPSIRKGLAFALSRNMDIIPHWYSAHMASLALKSEH